MSILSVTRVKNVIGNSYTIKVILEDNKVIWVPEDLDNSDYINIKALEAVGKLIIEDEDR